ncbi:MAG: DMT family transporter [Clostridia bacterium]|nr:DMT family transporter [Clostridia bacterium]
MKLKLNHPVVSALLASFCCLLWGSAIPAINIGYRLFAVESGDVPTLMLFAGIRFMMAGALTVVFVSLQKGRFVRPKKGNWDKALKLALVQTIIQYGLFYVGVANTESAKGSIIQGLSPFIAILVACYLFRSERMNALKWIGGLIGVAGVVIMNLTGDGMSLSVSLLGEGFLLLSLLSNACSAGMIKIYGRHDDPATLSGWQFMIGGAVMAVCGFAAGGRLLPQGIAAYCVLLYLALLSAVAYTLWALLLSHNAVSRITVFHFLQPIFGVGLGLLLGTAKDVPLLRCGAALVLVSLSIVIVVRAQHADAK